MASQRLCTNNRACHLSSMSYHHWSSNKKTITSIHKSPQTIT
jgi:hypothetical protein